MIVISKYIVPKNFIGITLFPFIFLRYKHLKENTVLVRHEKIHLKQQLELLIVFFYVFYVFEWLIKLVKYKNKHLAYRNISFEKEAYLHESNPDYLKQRTFWAFIKYI